MTITTKKGDSGKSYWMGRTVDKDDVLLETVGTIDELQASLAVARVFVKDKLIKSRIIEVEKDLWAISGELACGSRAEAMEDRLLRIEKEEAEWEKKLKPIRKFLIPGSSKVESLINLSRTVCRRAERKLVALGRRAEPGVRKVIMAYINRLSDYLFIMGRISEEIKK